MDLTKFKNRLFIFWQMLKVDWLVIVKLFGRLNTYIALARDLTYSHCGLPSSLAPDRDDVFVYVLYQHKVSKHRRLTIKCEKFEFFFRRKRNDFLRYDRSATGLWATRRVRLAAILKKKESGSAIFWSVDVAQRAVCASFDFYRRTVWLFRREWYSNVIFAVFFFFFCARVLITTETLCFFFFMQIFIDDKP